MKPHLCDGAESKTISEFQRKKYLVAERGQNGDSYEITLTPTLILNLPLELCLSTVV
jgi:hypothetical protein